jgi:hypothetical protein
MNILRRLPPFLASLLLTFGVAVLVAALQVFGNGGFGSGDLGLVSILSAHHALFTATWGWALARCLRNPFPYRRGVFTAFGVLGALVMTLVTWFMYGAWFGAISISVLYVWALAGGVGIQPFVADIRGPRKSLAGTIGPWLLLAASPLLLFILLFVVLTSLNAAHQARNRAEDAIVLIPKGFTGPFIIAYDTLSGEDPVREGSVRIYRIPRSGILRTRFASNQGYFRTYYLYEDSLGNRIELPSAFPENRDSLPSILSIGSLIVRDTVNPGMHEFDIQSLIVGIVDRTDSLQARWEQMADSMAQVAFEWHIEIIRRGP